MGTITLDDRDRAVLDRLRRGDADVETLSAAVGVDTDSLRDRLPDLADNGLVRRVDDGYELTENGERAMAGSPAGTEDNRIDTPPDAERTIQSFDLRADRTDAVRAAFAFLKYWGTATESEIIDGVYSEAPAGFESHETWWTDCVRDRLADLPRIRPPSSSGEQWRYDGIPVVEQDDGDGRVVSGDDVLARSSVRAAVADSDLDEDEQSAMRAAFATLLAEGETTAAEFRTRVYPDHDAGYDSAAEWWDELVRAELASLPGVESPHESADVWEYRQTTEGPVPSSQAADVSADNAALQDESDK